VDPSTTPMDMEITNLMKLDRKAKTTILLCLSNFMLVNVLGEATTKVLWDKLGLCISLSLW
jgi:hypothetical protein